MQLSTKGSQVQLSQGQLGEIHGAKLERYPERTPVQPKNNPPTPGWMLGHNYYDGCFDHTCAICVFLKKIFPSPIAGT